MTRVLFLFALSMGMLLPVSAEIQLPDTIDMEEVVVSGNRVEVKRSSAPVSLTVVSKEEIKSQEESNILPVVSMMTPGMFISEIGTAGYSLGNGTSGVLTIRGVGGSPNAQVMMMVDGQPQFMGIFGHPLPNFHVASNVERVEVIRGPASLLYGSNAMGGVINVITNKEYSDGFKANASASYGSFNTQKYHAGLSYKKGKFSAGISLNHDQTDGHRDTSSFRINNLNAFGAYRINSNWKLKAALNMAEYSFEDPGSELDDNSQAFLGDIIRSMATLSLRNRYERFEGGIYAYYNVGSHDFSDGWESDDVNVGVNIYEGASLWKGNKMTAGIDFKYYGGIGSFGMHADSFLVVREAAAYLLADQKLGSILSFNLGLRYENHSVYKSELVPQAGLTFKPTSSTWIKGLVSKGFRSPTIMDLYLFAPNTDLGPERLWNYELSVSQAFGSIAQLSLSAFIIEGSNLITMVPNTNPGPPMIKMNTGEFMNSGLEFESTYSLMENLKLDLNYSFIHTDRSVYFTPRHKLFLGGHYEIGDFRVALNLNGIKDLYTLINNEDPSRNISESYMLLNSKIIYAPLDFLEVYLAGKNLLNQEYQTVLGYPMPGINFMTGISVYLK